MARISITLTPYFRGATASWTREVSNLLRPRMTEMTTSANLAFASASELAGKCGLGRTFHEAQVRPHRLDDAGPPACSTRATRRDVSKSEVDRVGSTLGVECYRAWRILMLEAADGLPPRRSGVSSRLIATGGSSCARPISS